MTEQPTSEPEPATITLDPILTDGQAALSTHDLPGIPLTIDDITPLDVNRQKLARALAKALACNYQFSTFTPPQTWQVGSWSSASVPVILTIQYKMYPLRSVIAELALRLRHPFILFSPTTDFMDAQCQELLADAQAAFFPLDATVQLNHSGTLVPLRPPADLFAQFSPNSQHSNTPLLHHPTPHSALCTSHYALRKGLGVWDLIFGGEQAPILHEKAVFYVAWLLYNPPEHPIHAIDLMAKIPVLYRQQLGLPELVDPATGKSVPLESHARIQERSLALDDAQAMRAIYRKEKELEAILDSEDESEPVKAEALRELEQIAEFQRQNAGRSKDSAQRAAQTVRKAIKRFHRHLSRATDHAGNPHPVLCPFAQHLEQYLLTPSSRYSGPGRPNATANHPGCLTYEPPPGVSWAD